MKALVWIIYNLFKLLRDAVIALVVSGVISLSCMLFKEVSWGDFFWGAVPIFACIELVRIYDFIRSVILGTKDPRFLEAYKAGISWREYKRMRNDIDELVRMKNERS